MSGVDFPPASPDNPTMTPAHPLRLAAARQDAEPAADVDGMLGEMAHSARALPREPAARPTLQRVRYTHEACIDMILAEPGISQDQLAAIFGYSASWMSIAINSDAFQARLAERKAEMVDPVIRASLNERLRAVTQRSLDVLLEKLCKPSASVSDQLVVAAANLGVKGLGLGQQPASPPASADHLNELASRLRGFLKPSAPPPPADIVDVPSREV